MSKVLEKVQQTAAPAAAPEKKRAPVLVETRMQEREQKVRDWVIDVETDVTVDEMMKPGFWAFVSPQFQPGDSIEARPDDFSWFAFLKVVYAERNFARVILDRVIKCEMNTEVPQESIKHKAEYRGGHLKWCVIRIEDSQVLQEVVKTRELANEWIKNYETTLGR